MLPSEKGGAIGNVTLDDPEAGKELGQDGYPDSSLLRRTSLPERGQLGAHTSSLL
jgi:hypothetical protein